MTLCIPRAGNLWLATLSLAWLSLHLQKIDSLEAVRHDLIFSILHHSYSWQASELPTPLPGCSSKLYIYHYRGGCSGELGAQYPQDVFSWMSLKWEDYFCFCFRLPLEHWIFYPLRSHWQCCYLGIFRHLEEAWEAHIVTKQPFVAACIKDGDASPVAAQTKIRTIRQWSFNFCAD